MKYKFYILFLFLFINSTVYGQLNITSSSSDRDTTYFYKDNYAIVKYDGASYLLCCADFFRPTYFYLILGSTVDETINSLKQLNNWYTHAKKKDYITIGQKDGSNVTLYKYSNTKIIMSYGDVDYIGKKYNEIVIRLLFTSEDITRKVYDNFDPYFGFLNAKVFSESLQNIISVYYPEKYDEIRSFKRKAKKFKFSSDDLYE